jgi:hypothetical protein
MPLLSADNRDTPFVGLTWDEVRIRLSVPDRDRPLVSAFSDGFVLKMFSDV